MEHFNWITGFWFPYVNFAIFLFIVVKFGKQPIKNMFEEKNKAFQEQLNAANKAKEEAERQLREAKQQLESLANELNRIKEAARVDAEREGQKLSHQGEQIVQQIDKESKRLAHLEIQRFKEEMEVKILEGVRKTVLAKLQKELSQEKQKNLLDGRLSLIQNLSSEV